MNITINKPIVNVYTDGSYRPQTNIGGYAAYLVSGAHHAIISGHTTNTTNNRMELFAIYDALRSLRLSSIVNIFTDSKYAISVFKKYDRFMAEGNPLPSDVLNGDIIGPLIAVSRYHDVNLQWVPAHAGVPENEFVDQHAYIQSANGDPAAMRKFKYI